MPEIEYLPHKAINIFIERDYLEKVLNSILEDVQKLPKDEQIIFTNLFKKYVTVLGFRNPLRAPLGLQVNAYVSAFEKKDEVIPFTLTTWTRLNLDFAEKVRDWLESEGWEVLTLARTFEESEGFNSDWPEDLSFDQIEEKFKQTNPDVDFTRDDLILMVLWITGYLPKEQSDL
jgi:hypothetical protein